MRWLKLVIPKTKLLNNLIFGQVHFHPYKKWRQLLQKYETNKGTMKRMKIFEYPGIQVNLKND